jgi:hypothetical protein
MPDEIYVATAPELPPGTIKGAGRYAVGVADRKRFAVDPTLLAPTSRPRRRLDR